MAMTHTTLMRVRLLLARVRVQQCKMDGSTFIVDLKLKCLQKTWGGGGYSLDLQKCICNDSHLISFQNNETSLMKHNLIGSFDFMNVFPSRKN